MERNKWLSPRGLAIFAGGASIGLAASRLLPPMLAQAGVWPGSTRDPFAILVEDHHRFADLLTEMERSRGEGMLQRTQLLLRLKRGLAAHAMAEEDVIYPLLAEEAGAPAAAERLYSDHGWIKTHLYALEKLIGDETAWIERAAELKRLISDHAAREEEVEFPRIKHLLDEEDAERVARHVARERAMVL